MKDITIPVDAERILLVSNTSMGYCSLFLNGKRVRMFQLDRDDDNCIQVSLTVKKLAELAAVTVIHDLDPRVLSHDPDEPARKRRWYQTLAEASKRQDELNEAAALRARVKADLQAATRLEAAR